MNWPSNVDEAVASLARSLNDKQLEIIRSAEQDQLPIIYQRYRDYVLNQSATMTREVAKDLDVDLDANGLARGADFLIYLLWSRLQETDGVGEKTDPQVSESCTQRSSFENSSHGEIVRG